jgi:hypothetical protein
MSEQEKGWQPITTAPKDAPILVYDPATGVEQAQWGEHWGVYEFRGWSGPLNPTHWMPLPEPPADA